MRLPIATYGRRDCAQASLFLLGVAGLAAWLPYAAGIPALSLLAILPIFFAGFVVSFYRDFERVIPAGAGLVVSPADGTVTDVVEVDERDYLGERALRIGIFLSPLNVHVNRAPVQGTVEKVVPRPGKMLKAYDPRAIDENESVLLGLKTDEGLKVGVRQVTGALARRIVCAVAPGTKLAKGERYGMIKLGSRTELLVPLSARMECSVKVGDKVSGGVSILGRLPVSGAPSPSAPAAPPPVEAKL
ncbi:MAG TPA: phosphatidylserine decarboxylase [Planctomycetota bacterium]|nr:phosphatidylserine decarboxylase [Planctomycetota bacterium]